MESQSLISFNEDCIVIEVATSLSGALSRVAKPPRLGFKKLTATLVDGNVSVDLIADSIFVLSKDIPEKDQAHILLEVRDKILKTRNFKTIEFRSKEISKSIQGGFELSGELKLVGTSRSVRFMFEPVPEKKLRFQSALKLCQTDYGIKPISTMLGAIRCGDEIEISVTVQLDQEVAQLIGR